ncbi:SRPBCC domain-containing protein [Aminobacter sp. HY435]|uniref:SRPBCC domain-containing protein n=1 Tax=Aminobacter sp. HY435 TaxID=2970917 RepID=UPI0022B979C0|nr:SRPBCC domain-containing protein [Aminobacter sp. HY435]
MPKAHHELAIHASSRQIAAAPIAVYKAFLDPDAVLSWRPPEGMRAEIHSFEPREGGAFRMAFIYSDTTHSAPGKTSDHIDLFDGRFVELVPGEKIVEAIEFLTNDPAFAGVMRVVTTLKPIPQGTEVTMRCENVPRGISEADHIEGMNSTLQNLADYLEPRTRTAKPE